MEPPGPSVTLAPSASSFTPSPIIHELLRTRYAVPGSIFLVEDVQTTLVSNSGRWQVIRLLLGDGELCIQAVLGGPMHRFVHTREIAVGSYVRVQDFQLRVRNVSQQESMVYLAVYDLQTFDWNQDVRRMHALQRAVEEKGKSSRISKPMGTPTKPPSSRSSLRQQDKKDFDKDDMEDVFEEFEALTFPTKPKPKSPANPASNQSLPIALARDWHDVQSPLKLTTLRSVPNLPYRQNWSCNVLAIIAALSAVEASKLPPYKQRTAKITDPSTAKQVHLTVFLDPDEFNPKVGSAVLLTGVKNHWFDGGSLKKYQSDNALRKWWFEDPWELAWCDVKGIKDWWAEMEAFFGSQPSEEVIGGDEKK